MPLTAEELTADPTLLTRALSTQSGLSFTARLLRPEDGHALGRYFDGLTEATTGMYGPHPLTGEHAQVLCGAIDYAKSLRFIVEIGADIIGYFILDMGVDDKAIKRYARYNYPLEPEECCTFAPSVTEAYFSQGIGSALMPLVFEATRRLGRQRIVLMGGVRGDNLRAQHFYRKFGFERVGEFFAYGVDNLDMVLQVPNKTN